MSVDVGARLQIALACCGLRLVLQSQPLSDERVTSVDLAETIESRHSQHRMFKEPNFSARLRCGRFRTDIGAV